VETVTSCVKHKLLLFCLYGLFNVVFSSSQYIARVPIPVAARAKVWVCGASLAAIAVSNPAVGMDVCLLWVLCVVR
jgi:hypothetical protein